MIVVTNNIARTLVSFHDLPESAQAEFDYVSADDRFTTRFFNYKGDWFDSHEFIRVRSFPKWHGAMSDTYFSGMLIRITDDAESVVVGRWFC